MGSPRKDGMLGSKEKVKDEKAMLTKVTLIKNERIVKEIQDGVEKK